MYKLWLVLRHPLFFYKPGFRSIEGAWWGEKELQWWAMTLLPALALLGVIIQRAEHWELVVLCVLEACFVYFWVAVGVPHRLTWLETGGNPRHYPRDEDEWHALKRWLEKQIEAKRVQFILAANREEDLSKQLEVAERTPTSPKPRCSPVTDPSGLEPYRKKVQTHRKLLRAEKRARNRVLKTLAKEKRAATRRTRKAKKPFLELWDMCQAHRVTPEDGLDAYLGRLKELQERGDYSTKPVYS